MKKGIEMISGLEEYKKVNVIYNTDTQELFIDDYDTGEQLAVFKNIRRQNEQIQNNR